MPGNLEAADNREVGRNRLLQFVDRNSYGIAVCTFVVSCCLPISGLIAYITYDAVMLFTNVKSQINVDDSFLQRI